MELAAANLNNFVEKVLDVRRTGRPTSLNVITAGGFADTRQDGVNVIPITSLGP